jgi:hypothetical protein
VTGANVMSTFPFFIIYIFESTFRPENFPDEF